MRPATAAALRARKVLIYNLIPFFLGKEKNVLRVAGTPEEALKTVWRTCAYRAKGMSAWVAGMEEHCPVPPAHPFRKISDRLRPGDPLRTLGCWAYGAENSWITIDEILWEDGTRTSPQEEHRAWLRRDAAKVVR